MYTAFYGLREKPFNLTPDPRFLYLSEKHKEAFAHLLYGIRSRSGFVMVTGEIGTGKTTICRNLLNQLDEDTEVAFIFNPMLGPLELLRKIVSEFGIDAKGTNALELTEELNEYLLEAAAKGKNCVLLIDEAQNLDPQVLEQIRLLSNLETETEKLLQIVLIGQPELGEKLALHELRQLNQRITARYHLRPLSEKEVLQYVAYRLHVAGGRRRVKFARSAVRAVYKISKGTPRVINALCDRALLIGFTKEVHTITKGIVHRAYREIRGEAIFGQPRRRWTFRQLAGHPVAGIAAACILAAVYLNSPALQSRAGVLVDRVNSALAAPDSRDTTSGRNIAQAKSLPAPAPDPESVSAARVVDDTTAPPEDTGAGPGTRAPDRPDESADSGESEDTAKTVEALAQLPALADLLGETDSAESDQAAIRALLAAWNREPAGSIPRSLTEDTVDAFLRQHAWSHDRLKPALGELLALDLPALVKVVAGGEPRWIALTGAQGDVLTVSAGETSPVQVARADFEALYAAEAIVPWTDPAPDARALREGQANAAVAELKEKLRQLSRLPEDNTSDTYDVETASAVSRIQAETSLEVDGIAGPQVRMVLSSWLKEGETPGLRGNTAAEHPARVAKHTPAEAPTPSARTEANRTDGDAPDPKPAPEVTAPADNTPEPDPAPAAAATAETPEPEPEPAPETETEPEPEPETAEDTENSEEVTAPDLPVEEETLAESATEPDGPQAPVTVDPAPLPEARADALEAANEPEATPEPVATTPAPAAPSVEDPRPEDPLGNEADSKLDLEPFPAAIDGPDPLGNTQRNFPLFSGDSRSASESRESDRDPEPAQSARGARLQVKELDDPGRIPADTGGTPAEAP